MPSQQENYMWVKKNQQTREDFFFKCPTQQGCPPGTVCVEVSVVGSCSWENQGGFAGVLQVRRGFAKAPGGEGICQGSPRKGLSIPEQWHKLNCSKCKGSPAEHPGRSGAGCAQPLPVLKSAVTGRNLSYFTPELLIISFPFLPQCPQFSVQSCCKWPWALSTSH